MPTRELTRVEAGSAAAIQAVIDSLAGQGGRIVLPEMDITLDRGIELRSGVELAGRGERTVLRKGPGRVYPLTGYHNYGMADVPLQSTARLAVGMTVSVHDNVRKGFYETFARITWIDGNWVGLDHGIEADYAEQEAPRLTTAYPMIFGHRIRDAAVRDLTLDGRRQDQDEDMGGCRGSCVYLYQSRDVEVCGVRERDYLGEGLGFQMCRDIDIRNCRFTGNSGNGMHPGAGSTNARFEDCVSTDNGKSGFYFCVRANHITVRGCTLERNANGVSIGTRDCHNLIESCRIADNKGPGVLARFTPESCRVHSCIVRNCDLAGNTTEEGEGQIAVLSGAHDLLVSGNRVTTPDRGTPAIYVEPGCRGVCCVGNEVHGPGAPVQAPPDSLTDQAPAVVCGHGTATGRDYRHLDPLWPS